MENTIESYDHSYLFSLYPSYDYHSPTRPWELHCRDNDGILKCKWQMKAFHYFWLVEMCKKTGEIGLAINIENLPFCLYVDNRPESGHIFCHHQSITKLFSNVKFPLIVGSALIPFYPCNKALPKCEGAEVAQGINVLASIVAPRGVFIAAIMDETGPMHEGRSLKESLGFAHVWTPKNFEATVLKNIDSDLWSVDEFNTFKNDLSYNLVLRRK